MDALRGADLWLENGRSKGIEGMLEENDSLSFLPFLLGSVSHKDLLSTESRFFICS